MSFQDTVLIHQTDCLTSLLECEIDIQIYHIQNETHVFLSDTYSAGPTLIVGATIFPAAQASSIILDSPLLALLL